jgi:4-diphosphocytidyl-2-C-methyl-D-erythritol kinase
VLLLIPSFAVSTAEAYGWLAESRAGATPPEATPSLDVDAQGGWEVLEAMAANDFEPLVVERHPAIGTLVHALRASGCRPAMMSGSGSVVFGVLPDGVEPGLPRLERVASSVLTRTATRVEPVVALD